MIEKGTPQSHEGYEAQTAEGFTAVNSQGMLAQKNQRDFNGRVPPRNSRFMHAASAFGARSECRFSDPIGGAGIDPKATQKNNRIELGPRPSRLALFPRTSPTPAVPIDRYAPWVLFKNPLRTKPEPLIANDAEGDIGWWGS